MAFYLLRPMLGILHAFLLPCVYFKAEETTTQPHNHKAFVGDMNLQLPFLGPSQSRILTTVFFFLIFVSV